MSQKTLTLVIVLLLLTILVIGVGFLVMSLQWLTERENMSLYQTTDSDPIASQVAQTVSAEIARMTTTLSYSQTSTPEPFVTEPPTQTPTVEPLTPSNTPWPTAIVPTNTPFPPTMIVPTFTPKPLVCDRAQLVRDVSVEDNSPFAPGTIFVKTWRLKNTGNCPWTTAYRLVLRSGDAMDANLSIPLPSTVAPDQAVDVSVSLKAPNKTGTYRGDWMLSSASGARFGIGPNGDQSFWVQIQVMNIENANLAYDFVANACKAEWSSGAGRLPCPGSNSANEGYVILSNAPHLENRHEDEWALLTHPNNHNRGWISGVYPAFEIQPNQHFTAWIGCLADSKGCNVNFRLDFKNLANGNTRNLGSWREVYDGEVTKIDLDLSEHAGKNVRFILTVEISGGNPAIANVFWFVPGIEKMPSPTATSTPSPPTATPTPTETPTMTETPTETPTTTP